MGDMNVAPLDADIGIGEDNAKRWPRTGKCSFLPEERDWLQSIMDCGVIDAYRVVHPDVTDRFSWFDYRSRGFEREPKRGLRIDTDPDHRAPAPTPAGCGHRLRHPRAHEALGPLPGVDRTDLKRRRLLLNVATVVSAAHVAADLLKRRYETRKKREKAGTACAFASCSLSRGTCHRVRVCWRSSVPGLANEQHALTVRGQ
jgi:hypothetical protein